MTKTNPYNFPPEIQEYIDIVEKGEYKVAPEVKALIKHVKLCFKLNDIYIDIEQLNDYMHICDKYLPFKLFPWQRFLIALHDCTYWTKTGEPRWRTLFVEGARGLGKDGMITAESFCLISPYNHITEYDVDVCANNEEQAMRPVEDLTNTLEDLSKKNPVIKRFFYWTKQVVKGKTTNAKLKGRTNNPKGRDGMRSGIVIFNEVHQYESYDSINVFMTSLGKKPHARVSYYSSNGKVREGPFDELEEKGLNVLASNSTDDGGFLPFINKLASIEQIHDKSNWYIANPSLQYFPHLLTEMEAEYEEWKDAPGRFTSFPIKRMGLKLRASETEVTSWDNIKKTNQPLIDLKGMSCSVGIDYMKSNDWMAVNLHFKVGDKRYDINHAWVCSQSVDLPKIKAPWQEWQDRGLITYIDDVEIHPEIITDYIEEMAKLYNITKIGIDYYRYSLLSSYLAKIGFSKDKGNLKLVKQVDIIGVVPVIEHYFIQEAFCWGDNPMLRWATNNTKLIHYGKKQGADKGSFVYAKIDAEKRKTDPFMALVASVAVEDDVQDNAFQLPPLLPVMTF